MGSSLLNIALDDVQRVNKVKSEYNSGANSGLKVGSMFNCINMATKLNGVTGIGSMIPISPSNDVSDVLSNHSNSSNPF